MSFCVFCGKELRQDARFCDGCGKAIDTSTTLIDRKIQFDGKVKKCPNCGALADSFIINCPICGHEFRDANSSSAVKEFALKYEQIGREGGSKSDSRSLPEKGKRKIDLIRSFPIPNTKEDVYEFMVLASSNIETRYAEDESIDQREISNAWNAKFEQAYAKAELLFGNSSEFDKIKNIYNKKTQEIKESEKKKEKKIEKKKKESKRSSWWGNMEYWAIILLLIVGLAFLNRYVNHTHEKENQRLELIVDEVYEAIREQDYVGARVKAQRIIFTKDFHGADELRESWDKVRNDILEEIEQAEKGQNEEVP